MLKLGMLIVRYVHRLTVTLLTNGVSAIAAPHRRIVSRKRDRIGFPSWDISQLGNIENYIEILRRRRRRRRRPTTNDRRPKGRYGIIDDIVWNLGDLIKYSETKLFARPKEVLQ